MQNNRCDRCRQAFTHVARKDKLVLAFCTPHTNKHEPSLTSAGWVVYASTNVTEQDIEDDNNTMEETVGYIETNEHKAGEEYV
mgnify:CR=1 FL=1